MDMFRTKAEAKADLHATIALAQDVTDKADQTYLDNMFFWFSNELSDPCPWIRVCN